MALSMSVVIPSCKRKRGDRLLKIISGVSKNVENFDEI